MVFIPIMAHSHNNLNNSLILRTKNKKVVVKGMDFTVKTGILDNIYSLDDKIKDLANGRDIIDYQILPYKTSTYGMYIEEYLVIVTCKKRQYD